MIDNLTSLSTTVLAADLAGSVVAEPSGAAVPGSLTFFRR